MKRLSKPPRMEISVTSLLRFGNRTRYPSAQSDNTVSPKGFRLCHRRRSSPVRWTAPCSISPAHTTITWVDRLSSAGKSITHLHLWTFDIQKAGH